MKILPIPKKFINTVCTQGYGTRVERSGGDRAESMLVGGLQEEGKEVMASKRK